MRVLLLAHQFLPEDYAGTEVLTLGIAKELRARGHDARVFAAKRSIDTSTGGIRPGETEDYEYEGVPVRRVGRPEEGFSRPYRLNYDNPVMSERARQYSREFRPEVVHAMHLQGLTGSVLDAFSEVGAPIVYTATDFWTVCPVVDLMRHDGVMCGGPDPAHCPRCLASRQRGSRLASLVERTPGPLLRAADAVSKLRLPGTPLPLRQVRDLSERPAYIRERVNGLDRVLAPTWLTRDILVENGVDPEVVEVSHYGIDVSNVKAVSRGAPVRGRVRFGFIGTLGSHKGPDLLVRAFGKLPCDSGATLAVHGGDTGFEGFRAELERMAGDDERISFPGTFPPERIWAVLSEMDVLVVPSRWYENTPLVVYSAFAAGVPVVATDLGGLSEVVEHGRNGLLFPLEDIEELAGVMGRLVTEPDLLDLLRVGIGPVKTMESYADEMEKLYNALMEHGGKGL